MRDARAGILVCWDQWFPEAARATALAGAGVALDAAVEIHRVPSNDS